MTNVLERVERLSPQERAMLIQRLKAKKNSAQQKPLIPRLPRLETENTFPLSFAQERMWFLDQLGNDRTIYNTASALLIKGELDRNILERSLNAVVQRHEILRTSFRENNGLPVQVVAPKILLPLNWLDLSRLPEMQRQDEARRLITADAQRSFDLAHGPMLRATLLHLGAQEHVLFLTIHHIIADGWSAATLIRDLMAFYDAFTQGKPTLRPELPVQYADFAAWQRQYLQGKVLEDLLAYWKEQMTGSPPVLELLSDRSRPAEQTYRGASHSFALSSGLTTALRGLCQQERVTLFMVLLAAFQVLLYRYSGQTDIVVGTPIANRNHAELEHLIGFFINTLALRTDLSGNPSFRELLKRVREVALGAYAHQDLPFEMLVETLRLRRNLSHTPLFQVMLVLQNVPLANVSVPGLEMSIVENESGVAQFDLILAFTETEQGLSGVLEYNTDLFDPDTISRMVGHLQNLLEGMVENPDRCLSELPFLTEAERQQLLVTWNPIEAAYPQDQCIHELVETQVIRTPDAVAVTFEDQQLTYHELNERANQLAHHLQELGVQPGMLVGLRVERSLEMVVGILGILKAGGAYVPLEPGLPVERLVFVLDDLAQAQPEMANILVTQSSLAADVPASAKAVYLDTEWPSIAAHAACHNPNTAVNPGQPAYVIYTSGSTGKPKGCIVTHANVARLFTATEHWYGFRPDDVWTLFHSYAFDFSVWELWGALFYGGRVVVVPYLVSRSPEAFYELLHRERVTVLNQTPSAFRQLIQAELSRPERKDLALRYVIFGGEALELQSLRPWFDMHGDERPQLVNMYGITETTVHVTYRPLSRADLNQSASLIGRPIPDLQLYILDPYRQPVPIGVMGEIYVGGAGVCAGYLNRPQLTQERFIHNPFLLRPPPVELHSYQASVGRKWGHEGGRLYKTGDLARYLANGDIEYLGRQDHQVKIRGFRIELGEIEAVLGQHPAVRENVVLVREDSPGRKQLVAYLVCERSSTPPIHELRSHLKIQLPEYMLPSAYIFLERLPLTPNGKLDRKALPAPDGERPELAEAYVPPRTVEEEKLVDIWKQVLGVERVGVHDNFFELGGDSLLCIQVVVRAKQAGLQMVLKQMFEYQTIAELTAALETTPIQAEQGLVTGNAALTPSQARFFRHNYPLPQWWNGSKIFKLRRSPDNATLLEQAMRQILWHHDALRARFQPGPDGWQQVIARPDETVSIVTYVDISGLPAKEREIAMMTEAARLQQSLDLAAGPLVRAVLFELGENKPHYLLLIVHHLVADGAAFAIIAEDIATACQQLACGEPVQLSPKTTSLGQWTEAVHAYASSAEFQQQLGRWLALPWDQAGPLPSDHPENKAQNRMGSHDVEAVLFNPEETERFLKEIPRLYNVQPYEVLLAAMVQSVTRWTGRDWMAIDTIDVGRMMDIPGTEAMDLSRTIGWLSTHHILLLKRCEASHPGDVLRSIKAQLLAFPKQGIPADIAQLSPIYGPGPQFPAWIGDFRLNYAGRGIQPASDVLQPTSLSPGATINPDCCESYLLGCVASIPGKRLVCAWDYSRHLYERTTIKDLTEDFKETLRSLL